MLRKWIKEIKLIFFVVCLLFNCRQAIAKDNVGCFYEKDLCESFEFCLDDGLTGKCILDIELGKDENEKPISEVNFVFKKLFNENSKESNDLTKIDLNCLNELINEIKVELMKQCNNLDCDLNEDYLKCVIKQLATLSLRKNLNEEDFNFALCENLLKNNDNQYEFDEEWFDDKTKDDLFKPNKIIIEKKLFTTLDKLKSFNLNNQTTIIENNDDDIEKNDDVVLQPDFNQRKLVLIKKLIKKFNKLIEKNNEFKKDDILENKFINTNEDNFFSKDNILKNVIFTLKRTYIKNSENRNDFDNENNNIENDVIDKNIDINNNESNELLDFDIKNNKIDKDFINYNNKDTNNLDKYGDKYLNNYNIINNNENYDEKNNDKNSNEEEERIKLIKYNFNNFNDNLLNLTNLKTIEEGVVHVEIDVKNHQIQNLKPIELGEKSFFTAVDSSYAYVHLAKSKKMPKNHSLIVDKALNHDSKAIEEGFVHPLELILGLSKGVFSNIKLDPNTNISLLKPVSEKSLILSFKVNPNNNNLNAQLVSEKIDQLKEKLEGDTGFTILTSGFGDKVKIESKIIRTDHVLKYGSLAVGLALFCFGLFLTLSFICRRNDKIKNKMDNMMRYNPIYNALFHQEKDYTKCNLESKPHKVQTDLEKNALDYQDLCRQRMKTNENKDFGYLAGGNNKIMATDSSKLSCKSNANAKALHVSAIESDKNAPLNTAINMNISTSHLILEFLENHLKQNGDKLNKEWDALCSSNSEDSFDFNTHNAAKLSSSRKKNRFPDDPSTWPFDHSRVILNDLQTKDHTDYINASIIIDADPNKPVYVATQGPLKDTITDFWQMVWEQGICIIVILTRLVENDKEQCVRYWPEHGSEWYLHFEVNLVSEHKWSEQYLVRSFYLKNLLTNETRTITQFHFLGWPENSVPSSFSALLEFRRKVNKSYKARSNPIIVHCSDGVNRTGAYCLIDLVLNRLTEDVKEIDLVATLEHLRDQRSSMVRSKAQFEFCLKAITEEVYNLLQSINEKSN